MNYIWRDYNPNTMGYVEAWLNESAIQSTGLDDGFRDFYEYWANEDDFVVGENFWCKVVFENDTPFAVIAFCRHEQKTDIMEVVIAPEKRGQGKGSKLLKEFLESEEITGCAIHKSEAVIYPDNIASQRHLKMPGLNIPTTTKIKTWRVCFTFTMADSTIKNDEVNCHAVRDCKN